jgi:hypothetical protein
MLGAACHTRSRKERRLQEERSVLEPPKRSLELSEDGFFDWITWGKGWKNLEKQSISR